MQNEMIGAPLVTVNESGFFIDGRVATLTAEEMRDFRETLIVAIGQIEKMWHGKIPDIPEK